MGDPGLRDDDAERAAVDAAPDGDLADALRAAGGDVAAFERLYRRHVDRIHALGRRMLGPGDSEDATQDVFVRAWDRLTTFRGDAAFGTWLYRLAINVLLARRAALATHRQRYASGAEADDAIGVASRPPAGVGLVLDLETAMERLPNGQREIVLLHDVEGYKHEEIAKLLGISTGTSKSQLHRARMTLRRYLE